MKGFECTSGFPAYTCIGAALVISPSPLETDFQDSQRKDISGIPTASHFS